MTGLDKEIENPVQEQEDEGTASPASITMTQSSGSSEDEYEKFLDEKERARKRQRFEGEKAENFPCKISKFRHAFYTNKSRLEEIGIVAPTVTVISLFSLATILKPIFQKNF